MRRNGEPNKGKLQRKGRQNFNRSRQLKGRSVLELVSSKLVLLKYLQTNVPPVWEHTKKISLMVCWKKNGFSAPTWKPVGNGCIAPASLLMKMAYISAISAKSHFPDFC